MALAQGDTVLVVDDSPDTVRLLTDVLDSAGMTVMVALDGMAALKIATRLKPDIVLMDAVMPGLDGFETCRRLKALSGFDNVPVIFMTGLTEPGDSIRGFEAGGADYVTKPVELDAMLARIGVHLRNARKIQSARLALDAAEQFLVAVDQDGTIMWFTPQAYRLVERSFADDASPRLRLPDPVLAWLRARVRQPPRAKGATAEETVHTGLHGASRIRFVGQSDQGEILFRISDGSSPDQTVVIRERFSLTPREAEVAVWIAQGKSNRDIAAILSLSPRTVDKHLELIFTKLAVENRTTAAALILNALKL